MKIKQSLPVGAILRSNLRTYKVVEILGSGTFGVTYKVVSDIMVGNVEISTFFAIKECFLKTCYRDIDQCRVLSAPTELQSFIDCKKDFIKEAKLLNKLSGQSKHIVQVNEVFEYNGTAYYVMKYLDGGSMEAYVRNHGAMSEAKALSIMRPITEAVCKIHQENLLHLDIKPSNIVLMTSDNSTSQCPVLIDFGISKHFTSKGKPTSAKFAKGASDGYSPMEQYASIPTFAPQLDVYALGATLLHLITGTRPPTAFEVTSDIINQLIPPSISYRTRNAIINAMHPQSAFRTPSAEMFLASLENEYTLPIGFLLYSPTTVYQITGIDSETETYIVYNAIIPETDNPAMDQPSFPQADSSPTLSLRSQGGYGSSNNYNPGAASYRPMPDQFKIFEYFVRQEFTRYENGSVQSIPLPAINHFIAAKRIIPEGYHSMRSQNGHFMAEEFDNNGTSYFCFLYTNVFQPQNNVNSNKRKNKAQPIKPPKAEFYKKPKSYTSRLIKSIVLTFLIMIISAGSVIGVTYMLKKCKNQSRKEKEEQLQRLQEEKDSINNENDLVLDRIREKKDSLEKFLERDSINMLYNSNKNGHRHRHHKRR